MSAQVAVALGVLLGLAIGAVLWLGTNALADRALDGDLTAPADDDIAAAMNAVGSAVDRWNAEHADGRIPMFLPLSLPLSLRLAIGRDVAAALAAVKPEEIR